MVEKKIKHLEMIQGVINRLSQNSFLLKGWSVVLLAALLTITIEYDGNLTSLVLIFPVLIFWYLDGFYLSQERKYRKLYEDVRTKEGETVDFSMNTTGMTFENEGIVPSVFSFTLIVFHGTLLVVTIIFSMCRSGQLGT